jgi:hypothetical protein
MRTSEQLYGGDNILTSRGSNGTSSGLYIRLLILGYKSVDICPIFNNAYSNGVGSRTRTR